MGGLNCCRNRWNVGQIEFGPLTAAVPAFPAPGTYWRGVVNYPSAPVPIGEPPLNEDR